MPDLDRSPVHRYGGQEFSQPLTAHATIVERMEAWAADHPDRPWLTAVGLDGGEETLTFGELERQSRRLAGWLAAEVGLRPGDVAAVLPANDRRSVVCIFALLRAGCSIFFISPAEPPRRLAELLGGMPVRAVLAPSPAVAARQPSARPVPDATELPAASGCAVARGEGSLYFGTSGSTATSKIVRQLPYNAAVNAEALRRHHSLGEDTRLLGCLPIHHVNGLHFTLVATLWSGAQAILLEAFNPAAYERCMRRHRPTLASVVPSILETLLLAWTDPPFPPGFRYFVSAAAPLPARTCAQVLDRFGVRVLQGYGLTETTNFSTTVPDGLSDAAYRRLTTDAPVPSIGTAVFGNEVAVLRRDGTPAPRGEVGEICMRGHNVMAGYAHNPAATAEAFQGGWFHSGDLGREVRDEETGLVFFVITGRRKNMAKVMGVAVSLEEMERVLRMVPAVSDAACFTVPDQLMGEAIVAAVVSPVPLDTAALSGHLRAFFGPAALPARYVPAQEIPRTATGKILRPQLPRLFAVPPAHAPAGGQGS